VQTVKLQHLTLKQMCCGKSGASVWPAVPFCNKALQTSLQTDGGASGHSFGFVRCKRQWLF
jgi:hypothetical protein